MASPDEQIRSRLTRLPRDERLVLVASDPLIASIPREYLRDQQGNLLAARYPLVRGLPELQRRDPFSLNAALEIIVTRHTMARVLAQLGQPQQALALPAPEKGNDSASASQISKQHVHPGIFRGRPRQRLPPGTASGPSAERQLHDPCCPEPRDSRKETETNADLRLASELVRPPLACS